MARLLFLFASMSNSISVDIGKRVDVWDRTRDRLVATASAAAPPLPGRLALRRPGLSRCPAAQPLLRWWFGLCCCRVDVVTTRERAPLHTPGRVMWQQVMEIRAPKSRIRHGKIRLWLWRSPIWSWCSADLKVHSGLQNSIYRSLPSVGASHGTLYRHLCIHCNI